MKKYVLGLAFWNDEVALIYKTKGPAYVIGTWNGIGGKIESYETYPEHAMVREFKEETGLQTAAHLWLPFAKQTGISEEPESSYELNCLMYDFSDLLSRPEIKNDEGDGEVVEWFNYKDATFYEKVTPNLQWIIPLALYRTTGFLEITEHSWALMPEKANYEL